MKSTRNSIANDWRMSIPWEVALFFLVYAVAPSYLAIEFSAKLPLLTVSRAILVIMIAVSLVRRRKLLFDFKHFKLKNLHLAVSDSRLFRWGGICYFVLLITVNLFHLTAYPSDALKTLLALIFEEYALVWILALVIDTREKLVDGIKLLVYASGVTGLIAVISCITDQNLFHLLKTTQREMTMTVYYRMGMLRAEAGFGHPVYYGAFCAVMIPLAMFMFEESKAKKEKTSFALCIITNLLGLILSNSRGSLLAFGCMVIFMLPFKLFMGNVKRLIIEYLGVISAALAALLIIVAMSPVGISFIGNVVNATLREIVPEQSTAVTDPVATDPVVTDPVVTDPVVTDPVVTDPVATDPVVTVPVVTDPVVTDPVVTDPEPTVSPSIPSINEDLNPNGIRSRLLQLSGIIWTAEREPLFGFGPNASTRSDVSFEYAPNYWAVTHTFDMDIVAIVCQYGLLGLLGYVALYGSVCVEILRKKPWKDKLLLSITFSIMSYGLCLLSISSIDKFPWILIGIVVCYINIHARANK